MKSKKKLIFIGVTVLIVLILAFNYNKIRFALDMVKIYNQEKDVESFVDNPETEMDNPLDVILESTGGDYRPEDEDTDTIHNDGNDTNLAQKDNSISDTNTSSNTNSGNSKDSEKNKPKTRSYIDIINEYNTRLLSLKSSFEGDLDGLIQEGINEYTSGDISKARLANRYLSLGTNLEKNSDAKFESLVKEMKIDLEGNGHSSSITKDTRDFYENLKSAKKSEVLKRGFRELRK